MRFTIWKLLTVGVSSLAIFAATDVLYLYYIHRKNHIEKRAVHDVAFVLSDGLPCCKHTENKETVQKCENPHCKAKLSHRIIKEIDSAKHLICIAM